MLFHEIINSWSEKILKFIDQKKFEKAKKESKRLAVNNNRTYWVIRGEKGKYYILNSDDIKRNKDVGIFKKSVNFIQLNRISSFIAIP